MRVFLTGGTGFLGGEIARQLVAAKHDVVALARNPARAAGLVALGAEVQQGDITDLETMRAGLAGADAVMHVAGWYKVGDPDGKSANAINVDGTRNVLSLMKEYGIKRGVYTSTLAVFSDTHGKLPDETYEFRGKHLSTYDETKWKAHYEVAEPMMKAGLPLIIVQPGVIYGPGDEGPSGQTLRTYLQGKLAAAPRQSALAWGHVEDVARGHLLALEKGRPGESYIVCGPIHTVIEALEMAQEITGVKVPSFRPRPGTLRFLARLAGFMEKFRKPAPERSAEYLRVNAGVTYLGNNAKARQELGIQMRPLKEGLRQTLLLEMEKMGMKPPAAAA